MNASRSARGAAAAVALAVALLALAPAARAEEVVLRSGGRYDATKVELLPGATVGTGRVRFSFVLGSGRGTVELPFERLDPVNLLGLALVRTPADDARGQLALAELAAALALPTEAEARYRRAAELDPALAPARDAGLASLRARKADAALAAAEAEIKRGRSDLALPRIHEVLAAADAGSPAAERARGLLALASKVVERDLARRAAEDAARAEASRVAAAAALASTVARAEAALVDAAKARGTVADPDLPVAAARTALEGAEARLREARRLLAAARGLAGADVAAVDAREHEALTLLVATDLDLAELHRQQRRFDRARDYLRAAQVFDPENPRIREVHDRVEADLRVPAQPDADDGLRTPWYGPWPGTLPGVGGPGVGGPAVGAGGRHVSPGYGPRGGATWRWSHGWLRLGW